MPKTDRVTKEEYLVDLLQVTHCHVADSRQFADYKCKLVRGGTCIELLEPAMPLYLTLDRYQFFNDTDLHCKQIQQAHNLWATEMQQGDESRKVKRTLIKLGGVFVLDDDGGGSIPGQKVLVPKSGPPPYMNHSFTTSQGNLIQQIFAPISWRVRQYEEKRRILKSGGNDTAEDELDAQMAAMSLRKSQNSACNV